MLKTAKRTTKLNPEQFDAVSAIYGKILVLAGAGSGKTSVIIERCVHLIKHAGANPSEILGLTFTNKAAEEMRSRISSKLGKERAKDITLSTFHSFCLSVLKEQIHLLGYSREFSIYDDKDIARLTDQITKQMRSESKEDEEIDDEKLQEELIKSLKSCNAVDFDGLLERTAELFEKFPDILSLYQRRYRFIMIDEYQDTNPIQYKIADLLSRAHGNLFVVGDDDQSIYSWRGSEVRHILNFPYNKIVKLEQNYRSTQPILEVANTVISHNKERHNKVLWSQEKYGDKVHIFHAPDGEKEAEAVVDRILYLQREKGLNWSDIAILYRSNHLTKPFEMALMKAPWRDKERFVRGVPYQVVQGMEFYERAEVKDLFAYLKVIHNPKDKAALTRIINYPRRGISLKTLDTLNKLSLKMNISIWELMKQADTLDLTKQAKEGIRLFVNLIEEAGERFAITSNSEAMRWLIDTVDFKDALHMEFKSDKARAFKMDNLESCIEMAKNLEDDCPTLSDFLGETLLDQRKQQNRKDRGDRVNLLTFHSAKGLEFKACFVVSLEDGIMPHEKSLAETGVEEERRLFYVALTRARQYLTLSMAMKRNFRGKDRPSNPSRFLFEIPKHLLEIESHNFITPFQF